MKKTVSICLIAAVLLSLAACTSKAPAPETTEATREERTFAAAVTTAAETEAPTEAATEAVTEESTEASAEAETKAPEAQEELQPVTVYLRQQTTCLYDDNQNVAARGIYTVPFLWGKEKEAYPALQSTFEKLPEGYEVWNDEFLPSMRADAIDMAQYYEGMELYDETEAKVLRADSTVVSLVYLWSDYSGGAHPNYAYFGENYDTRTGELLKISDVVKDTDRLLALADEKIKALYPDSAEYLLSTMDFFEGNNVDEYSGWTVENEGVTLYFSPYGLGSFADGAQVVTVYFDEEPELFEEKYLETAETYAFPFTREWPVLLDTFGNGKREEVSIEYDYVDEYSFYPVIKAGNRSVRLDLSVFDTESYVVRANGQYYLYLLNSVENDYSILYTVDLKTMEAVSLEDAAAGWLTTEPGMETSFYESDENGSRNMQVEPGFTDPSFFYMASHAEMFSTTTGVRTYHAGTDGVPVPETPYFTVPHGPVILTKAALLCDTVDENGTVTGTKEIPEGTFLCLVRTDSETYGDFQPVEEGKAEMVVVDEYFSYVNCEERPAPDYDGGVVRIYRTGEDWPHMVNDTGLAMDEVFTGMLFAG